MASLDECVNCCSHKDLWLFSDAGLSAPMCGECIRAFAIYGQTHTAEPGERVSAWFDESKRVAGIESDLYPRD